MGCLLVDPQFGRDNVRGVACPQAEQVICFEADAELEQRDVENAKGDRAPGDGKRPNDPSTMFGNLSLDGERDRAVAGHAEPEPARGEAEASDKASFRKTRQVQTCRDEKTQDADGVRVSHSAMRPPRVSRETR